MFGPIGSHWCIPVSLASDYNEPLFSGRMSHPPMTIPQLMGLISSQD